MLYSWRIQLWKGDRLPLDRTAPDVDVTVTEMLPRLGWEVMQEVMRVYDLDFAMAASLQALHAVPPQAPMVFFTVWCEHCL